MKVPHGEADYEADSVTIIANAIKKVKGKIRRTDMHHAQEAEAQGNVEIVINKQHPSANTDRRPPAGARLRFEDGEEPVKISARRIEKHGQIEGGRESAGASKGVWIFKKRRSKR